MWSRNALPSYTNKILSLIPIVVMLHITGPALVVQCPRNVVLVHGEKLKMVLLKNKIATDLGEKFTTDSI